MRYEMMLPHQLRQAMDENWPAVLPLGVLEYHGEHMAIGMDTLAVLRCLEQLESEMNIIILPPFYYGAGSYAVEGPAGTGTMQVDTEALVPFGHHFFRSLLRNGFRNIHAIIHHQSENFTAGMPTDLSFKLAGHKAIFEFLMNERGEGFWGDNSMADYYEKHDAGDNPFNWVQIHPLMDEAIIKEYDFDHAGIGETSLLMALDPAGVDMDQFSDEKWYLRTAKNATREYGQQAVDKILKRLRKILSN